MPNSKVTAPLTRFRYVVETDYHDALWRFALESLRLAAANQIVVVEQRQKAKMRSQNTQDKVTYEDELPGLPGNQADQAKRSEGPHVYRRRRRQPLTGPIKWMSNVCGSLLTAT
jgi:hypothetical protein